LQSESDIYFGTEGVVVFTWQRYKQNFSLVYHQGAIASDLR
jgi:hypothetical protein